MRIYQISDTLIITILLLLQIIFVYLSIFSDAKSSHK
jgi:hypothetical protein